MGLHENQNKDFTIYKEKDCSKTKFVSLHLIYKTCE